VAAIFHRGIPWVNIPTTLLAQVDSCIGGKTGVNTPAGKNLLGVVHHPALVIADIDTLATLPTREFNQGFAEIIKHAIISDAALFETLENFERENLEALVRRNIEIKAQVVSADERDTTGERALLNFGHTVGHAIEYAAGYRDLLHGEAVSLGIVAACAISMKKVGLSKKQRDVIVDLLRKFDLPTKLPANFPHEEIMKALPRDKKFLGGRVRFVVTSGIGSARLATDVTMKDIKEALTEL
jgi:3-dehydroquinate synthetase